MPKPTQDRVVLRWLIDEENEKIKKKISKSWTTLMCINALMCSHFELFKRGSDGFIRIESNQQNRQNSNGNNHKTKQKNIVCLIYLNGLDYCWFSKLCVCGKKPYLSSCLFFIFHSRSSFVFTLQWSFLCFFRRCSLCWKYFQLLPSMH